MLIIRMKTLGLLAAIFFISTAQSGDVPHDLVHLMGRLKLNLVHQGDPLAYPGVHAIFESQAYSNRFALLVHSVPGDLSALTLIQAKDYLIIQLPSSSSGHFHSIALSGIPLHEVKNAIAITPPASKRFRFPSLISKAYAADSPCSPNTLSPFPQSMSALAETTNQDYLAMAASCSRMVLQGAWESTGGLVQSVWSGLRNLVTNPRGFWDGKVEQYRAFREFLGEFDTRLQELSASLKQLPPEVLSDLICGFVGGFAGSFLLVGGIARYGPQLSLFMQRLATLSGALLTLQRSGQIRAIPRDFYQALSRGDIGPQQLRTIETYGNQRMAHLTYGSMVCAL